MVPQQYANRHLRGASPQSHTCTCLRGCVHVCSDVPLECVLLLYNVFFTWNVLSCYRICSLTIECVLWCGRSAVVWRVCSDVSPLLQLRAPSETCFSYYRMCSLTVECVLWCGCDVSRVLQLSAFSNGWRVRVALRWLAQRADARRHSSAHPDYQRIHRRAATHAFWI